MLQFICIKRICPQIQGCCRFGNDKCMKKTHQAKQVCNKCRIKEYLKNNQNLTQTRIKCCDVK